MRLHKISPYLQTKRVISLKMEILGFIFVPGWLITILVIFLSLYLYTAYKQSLFRRYGIPGPKPTPFLGTLPELIKNGMFKMDVESVQKYGTFFGSYVGNIPTVMVSDPEMIKEIAIKQFPDFQDRAQSIAIPKFWLHSLNNATGQHWRFLRNTLSPTFSSGKIRKMEPIFYKCLERFTKVLDEKASGKEPIDLQPLFAALTLDAICSSAFGIEINSQENPEDEFVKNARAVFNFNLATQPFFFLNFLFPETKHILKHFNMTDSKAIRYIKAITQRVIDERRKTPASELNDLLQLLIDAHRHTEGHGEDDAEGIQFDGITKHPLTDDEILANAIMFLLVGYDTSATALTWLAYCLATNMDVQEKLIVEIDKSIGEQKAGYDNVFKLDYLDMVLSETLRLYPPSSRTNRQVVHETVICGKRIPGGISVTFPVAGLHRLPEFWPDPEKFDPERFLPENKEKTQYAYLPFGIGPRNCIGKRLALLEVKMAIVTLLQNYRIEPSEKLHYPPKVGKTMIVKPEGGVWVKLVKRK